jgi:phage terminase large subunit-like protein
VATETRRFDDDRADRVVRFFEEGLVHTKGRWARKPFILAPWQKDELIRPLFGTVRWEEQLDTWVRQYTLAWIELARKPLALETPMLTANRGWTTMEDIQRGDEVYAIDGRPTMVKWVSPVYRERRFRVSTASGCSLVAGADHEWLVLDRSRPCGSLRFPGGRTQPEYRREVRTTRDLRRVGLRSQSGYRFALPRHEPVVGSDIVLPVDPYALGAWLGDGTSKSGAMSAHEDDAPWIRAEFERAGYRTNVTADPQVFYVRKLMTDLRALGVLKDKHIPEAYLLAGQADRLALLQGLLDTDGWAQPPRRHPSVGFCNKNRGIVEGVRFLARSLGFKPGLITSKMVGSYGPYFELRWQVFPYHPNPFRLPRKAALISSGERHFRETADAIVSIDPVGRGLTRCIGVAHESHTFLAGADLMVTMNCGKSEIVAGCGLYLLCADGEEESEVYGCARDRDQAGIIYQVAKRMVELSPLLSKQVAKKRLEVIDSKKRIVYKPTGSFYQVVAADGAGNLGSNPHGILFDEIITQPNRELWDAMKTGMGTRDQPLMLAATTAGNDPNAMAAEEHLHSEAVLADPSVDPARFVFMRNTPTDADWRDETNWYHANPALGDFLRIQILRDEAKEAERNPRKQNAFRQFRLNQWVRQVTRWIDMSVWDASAGLVRIEELRGKNAYGGIDMASSSDFAAWVLYFPGAIVDEDEEGNQVLANSVLSRFWLPEKAVREHKGMRETFELWAQRKWLTITPGDVIDHAAIRKQIDSDLSFCRVQGIGYDRWGTNEIVQWLKQSLPSDKVVDVPQTTTALNAPSKELERQLGLGILRHGGHPVLRWMADNVEARTDSNGNIKPDRQRSTEKIDGILALVDALYASMQGQPKSSFAFVL